MPKKFSLIDQESYTPNHLLDALMARLDVNSDAALARLLKIPASTISKIRHRHVPVPSALLLEAHELTELSIREMRDMMGDVHSKYWLGSIGGRSGIGYRSSVPAYRDRAYPERVAVSAHG